MLSWGPLALLLATIVNQLPVISALVPTEPIYVYLGTQVAEGSGYTSLAACLIGAWIGMQASYWLGRTAGARLVSRMRVGSGAIARAKRLFDRWGPGFVVVAQLIWPIATLAQVMSGIWGMRYRTFFFASGLGAMLAIAQYAAFGWLTAIGLEKLGLQPEETLLIWLGPYAVLIGFLVLLALGIGLILRRGRQPMPLRLAYAALLAVGMLIAVNIGTLSGYTDPQARMGPVPFDTACTALSDTLVARSGPTLLNTAQPVNLALIGVEDPGALLQGLGWLRNRTYAGDDLDAWEVVTLTYRGRPPASTLLLEGVSTDMAWQETRGTIPRTQLRLWPVAVPEGAPQVFLASVVRLDSIALRLAGRIPSLVYDLTPLTDRARNREARLLSGALGGRVVFDGPLDEPADAEGFRTLEESDFRSDGLIAQVLAPGAPSLKTLCGAAQRPGAGG
ncbi:VTT domain-containing protein [Pseudoroseicyclus aestuarii]|uniref:Membrane protein DedA with SNARE-associated domain n=1 Tax=Pseudoroseicyclus aestuarii TaxID=1795041 RepID=A0A318T1W0_9RHOB|nr:VTT domain-containing protein [Pseudoroseicyclus aestuarii]PYE85967.1 membrane protein DedA with SNARE-associated domain [Pseudoroseicyclus aestuarii]